MCQRIIEPEKACFCFGSNFVRVIGGRVGLDVLLVSGSLQIISEVEIFVTRRAPYSRISVLITLEVGDPGLLELS